MTSAYCSNCGAQLQPDANYCNECGDPVTTKASTESRKRTPNFIHRVFGSVWVRLIGLTIFSFWSVITFIGIINSPFPDPTVVQGFIIGFIGAWVFYGLDLWYRDLERGTKVLLALGGLLAFVIVVPLYTLYRWVQVADEEASRESKRLYYATGLMFILPIVIIPILMTIGEVLGGEPEGTLGAILGLTFVLSIFSFFLAFIPMYLDLRGHRLWGLRPFVWLIGGIIFGILVIPLYLYKRQQSFRNYD